MSLKALHDDPRDASLETKEILPYTWYQESNSDTLNTMGMFLSGLIVVTRNRYLAWAAILFALNGFINSHPTRSKGVSNQWSTLLLCISAFFASYFPLFIITKPVAT
ncbi:hypothetical protein Hypma_013165 [Hypsizygus marmoreus]|uniref:Protein Asterix n=1 Tax=Hypsizygus marmoreus TaxID=39966 RepID=A0A369JLP2_HYPMA|nr:hypothetical protein Hypma_013165 [Hypsizygus marmoreus]